MRQHGRDRNACDNDVVLNVSLRNSSKKEPLVNRVSKKIKLALVNYEAKKYFKSLPEDPFPLVELAGRKTRKQAKDADFELGFYNNNFQEHAGLKKAIIIAASIISLINIGLCSIFSEKIQSVFGGLKDDKAVTRNLEEGWSGRNLKDHQNPVINVADEKGIFQTSSLIILDNYLSNPHRFVLERDLVSPHSNTDMSHTNVGDPPIINIITPHLNTPPVYLDKYLR